MESQGEGDKSASKTPTSTPVGSSQGVADSNEPPTNSTTQDENNLDETLDDGVNVGSKRQRSLVWNHFKKMKVNGEDKAECNYCKKKLGGKSKNGTTHLRDHIERCPRRTIRDIRQSILVKEQKKADGSSSYLSNHVFNPEAYCRTIEYDTDKEEGESKANDTITLDD